MSSSHATALAEALRERAVATFEAAMREAPDDALWFLLDALDKHPNLVVRGSWGCLPGEQSATRQAATCPLGALALGRAPETAAQVHEAARISEERLAAHGARPHDFYGAWDQGLIRMSALRGQVDRHLTARILGGRAL